MSIKAGVFIACLAMLCSQGDHVSISAVSAVPQEARGTAEQHLEKGRQLLDKKEYDEARRELKVARSINPDLPEVYFLLGVIYKAQFDTKAATRFFEEAVRRRPDYAEAHYMLATLFLEQRRFIDAGREIDRAISNGWQTAEAYLVKASVELAREKLQSAVDAYEEALHRLDSDDSNVAEARETRDRLKENIAGIKRFLEFKSACSGPAYQGPKSLNRPRPNYTEKARQEKVQGTVRLAVEIDENGAVKSVLIFTRLGFGLDEEAVRAIRELKCSPGTMDGRPISCWLKMEVQFNLA